MLAFTISALALLACALCAAGLAPPAPVPAHAGTLPFIGHDISSLLMMERDLNVTYLDTRGRPQALERILAAGGARAARMRLWVHPIEGVYDLQYNLQLARRVQDAGMAVYLDFHYSDTWADPQHQIKPASWANLTFDALVHTIGTYTHDTLAAFRAAGVRLDLVELGNEIRNGLLWPDGETPNYANIAKLLKSASMSARAVGATRAWRAPMLGIHIDDGYSWAVQSTFYDSVLATGHLSLADFDAQLVSYYPFYSPEAALSNLSYTTTNMAHKYGKPIVVAETDWPVTCTNTTAYPFPPSTASIPFSAQGQIAWTRDILAVVQAIPRGLGQGLFYWEPGYVNNTGLGSECEDVLLFDADWSQWPARVTAKARASVNMFQGF